MNARRQIRNKGRCAACASRIHSKCAGAVFDCTCPCTAQKPRDLQAVPPPTRLGEGVISTGALTGTLAITCRQCRGDIRGEGTEVFQRTVDGTIYSPLCGVCAKT